MNDLNSIKLPWQVESLRFTLFYPIVDPVIPSGLWELITGLQPLNRTERPQEKLLIEEGVWEDKLLTVSKRIDRIDVFISSATNISPELPNIGFLDDVILKSSVILDKLTFSGVNRIAFGIVLLHPEHGHESAYQSLSRCLPNVTIKPGTQQFVYQINSPSYSKSDSKIKINRLQNWSAVILKFFNVLNNENSKAVELYAVRLELDINTHQDVSLSESSITRTQMDDLIKEAVAVAKGENYD
jgi:hypothetical protein